MPSIRPLRFGALAAILALVAACSGSDSTAPPTNQPQDLGKMLAELQPSSLAPLSSQISAAPLAGLSAPDPSSCSYDAASKSFVCPNVTVTGVVVSRSFTLFDASDNPQAAFDPATTAAIRMKSSFSGTVNSGGSTVKAVERIREQGLEVVAVVAVVDRLAGGGEAIEAATAAPYRALVTIDELYPDRPDRG